jgi:serine/threonine protein kinase
MGFVEGESLADRVRRTGPWSARETVRLLLDVAYALAYAHGRGVVHRDIKPDNIMIERATGRALLMDFGVARSIGATPATQAGMTRVGEVVGTPEYMSPEQPLGRNSMAEAISTHWVSLRISLSPVRVAFGGEERRTRPHASSSPRRCHRWDRCAETCQRHCLLQSIVAW